MGTAAHPAHTNVEPCLALLCALRPCLALRVSELCEMRCIESSVCRVDVCILINTHGPSDEADGDIGIIIFGCRVRAVCALARVSYMNMSFQVHLFMMDVKDACELFFTESVPAPSGLQLCIV